jgi:hypothetical protein
MAPAIEEPQDHIAQNQGQDAREDPVGVRGKVINHVHCGSAEQITNDGEEGAPKQGREPVDDEEWPKAGCNPGMNRYIKM